MDFRAMLKIFVICNLSPIGQQAKLAQPLSGNLTPRSLIKQVESFKNIDICYEIRPAFIYADFDGDGKADMAVLVINDKGKKGIWLKLSSQKSPIVLGCGYIDIPWDDWVFDRWSLFRRWQPINEPVPLRDSPAAPKPTGDYLVLSSNNAGDAVLYWDGKKMKIYSGE